jgi:hypothetical protein
VALKVIDGRGASSTDVAIIGILNSPPSIDVNVSAIEVDEAETAANSGTWRDPGHDVVSLIASLGSVVRNADGTWNWSYSAIDDLATTVTITVTDDDGDSSSVNFDLVVANVPPTANDGIFQVVENSPDGTLIGLVVASDPGSDVLSFGITGGTGAGVFAIDSLTGAITVADASQLDYETTTAFTLQVTVTDDDGGSGGAMVIIDVVNLPSISGSVLLDTNKNGLYEANELGIDGVIIELLDEFGVSVFDAGGAPITGATSLGGVYVFEDLPPGTYQLRELQPSGVDDGPELLGSLGDAVVANDVMQLTLERTDASDYYFSEFGKQLSQGDSAGIGFWQNKHGQELIKRGGSDLAVWLTANFSNVFGNQFVGATGADVAVFYKDQLFKQQAKKSAGPAKIDAQFMAVALAVYFTSRHLAGDVAATFGFNVTDTGIGTKLVNVGSSGAAFSVADNADLTIMQLLLASNSVTDVQDHRVGFASIYDTNGDDVIDEDEASLRSKANELYSWINQQGGI